MKKFLKIAVISIALIIISLVALPLIFKDKIVQMVKDEANNNLNAKLEFGDFDLTIFKSFPNLTLQIENLKIDGVDKFKGVTLASIGEMDITIDIKSVIGGGKIDIKKIGLDKANIYVKILPDGTANYNIVKSEPNQAANSNTETATNFKVGINQYYLTNSNIKYDDESMPMLAEFTNLNHKGTGDFTQDLFLLKTNTDIEKTNFVYDGVRYLNQAKTNLKADLEMDMPNMKFTFKENELQLNELFLGFDGFIAMPANDINLDLKYFTKKTDFKNLLSMVPADFTKDLKNVDVSGKLGLDGFVKGIYNEKQMPGFGLNLLVENGRFKYPDLPKSAENIQIKTKIISPAGSNLDKMTIDVSKFHLELGKTPQTPNTVDATLFLKTPISNPDINSTIKANLNFGSLKDVIPLEKDETLTGKVLADVTMVGKMSAIEKQQYESFKASGSINLNDVNYKSKDYSLALKIANLLFSPQNLELTAFSSIVNGTDINATGKLDNYLAYALKDSTIHGVFNVSSNKIDLKNFMDEEEPATAIPAANTNSEVPSTALEIPGNIDFTLNSQFGQLIYDNVVMSNVKGTIVLKEKRATLKELNFYALDGSVKMDGYYDAKDLKNPKVNFNFGANEIDITKTAATFNTVEKLAPIAKFCKGKVSTQFSFVSNLDQKMEPNSETITGSGKLSSKDIFISGFEPLNKLAKELKIEKLAKQNIQNIDVSFSFKDGKVIVEPYDIKVDKIDANIAGSTSFKQELDYLLKLKIPREMMGAAANDLANSLLSKANSAAGSNLSLGSIIKMNVKVGGTVTNPTIKPDFAGSEGSVKENIKAVVKEKVEEVKAAVKEKASEQAAKIIADAEKKAAEVKTQAKKLADKIRSEGDASAQKIMNEAKNPLAKVAAKVAADKVKKEAYKKADQTEAEAAKQADAIINAAKAQAAKIK
jgi:AsmA-like C-terminal region